MIKVLRIQLKPPMHGISTSRHYSIKSLNYQNISSDFNYSDFSNYFFKNFNFGLNKPLLHFLSDDRTKTDKNYTKKIDILCENESVIMPISSVGELSIIGILFKEQLSLELSPTLKVFLSILTNLCKNSKTVCSFAYLLLEGCRGLVIYPW